MSVRKHGLGAGVVMVAPCAFWSSRPRAAAAAGPQATAPRKLGKDDRALLAQARAEGEAT